MRDIWAFLLQTLTAGAAAVLLLCVKALFRDKLSPRWQFSVWALLALRLLIPVGLQGNNLFDCRLLLEGLKTLLAGEYTLIRVTAPLPLLPETWPVNLWQWLFCLYFVGVLWLLGRYFISYIRLRLALRQGNSADDAMRLRIESVAQRYGLRSCPAVAVEGLQSAFVCGVFSPVLALPADREVDEKVLLHELLHLKYRDSIWGILIALLRSLHWCNPLLWYCADQAGNDLESLCDQRVLERLEGEERREYGRILLKMANDTYARMPGTSSMANGGKNIRRRIEAIARYKHFPRGMELVSICMVILLALPLFSHMQQRTLYSSQSWLAQPLDHSFSMASARVNRCSTYAGALDTYAKAVLTQNAAYRAMCAPMEQQEFLARLLQQGEDWEKDLPGALNLSQGYVIYNLQPKDGGYEGLLVMELQDPPAGVEPVDGAYDLVVQKVRAQQEGENWIVLPRGEFESLQTGTPAHDWRSWGVEGLPWYIYAADTEDFRVEVRDLYIFKMDNFIRENSDSNSFDNWPGSIFEVNQGTFDTVPRPYADFDTAGAATNMYIIYTGNEEDKGDITRLVYDITELKRGTDWTRREEFTGEDNRYAGEGWVSRSGTSDVLDLKPDWKSMLKVRGSSEVDILPFSENVYNLHDVCYDAIFITNKHSRVQLTLTLQEGGGSQ